VTEGTSAVKWQAALDAIVAELERAPSVEGVFLSGSLVDRDRDDFSDVDLGVASRDDAEALGETVELRHRLLAAAGRPVHLLERGWEHCRMVAALFGKAEYPPIGLEIDIVFSQLRHVGEQMPYAEYRVLFDSRGRLRAALAELGRSRPPGEVAADVARHLTGFPFHVHDAVKACRRGDGFQVQSMLEEIRSMVFFAAATRRSGRVFGAKRAHRYLSAAERAVLQASYLRSDEDVVARLARLYLGIVKELDPAYGIADDAGVVEAGLRELL
jgi:predicted nucleotidyltransferase